MQYEQDKNMLIEKQNAYYLNQYLMTKEMYEESSKIQHDFKNILIGLKGKMERNENEKNTIEIDRIIGNYEMKNIFCNSGNIIIDSIINYKEQVAKKYQIPFSYELDIPSNLKLDTKIISVIMGNSLDNALEACQKFENSDCYININIQYLNESLYVRIENPYIKKIHKNFRGDISTIKSNKKIHGIGLKNIKKTLEEINGILDISYENNLFQIEFVLFNIKKD
ncbi:MAG: ATP-binding protein [Clostridiales bacterium]